MKQYCSFWFPSAGTLHWHSGFNQTFNKPFENLVLFKLYWHHAIPSLLIFLACLGRIRFLARDLSCAILQSCIVSVALQL